MRYLLYSPNWYKTLTYGVVICVLVGYLWTIPTIAFDQILASDQEITEYNLGEETLLGEVGNSKNKNNIWSKRTSENKESLHQLTLSQGVNDTFSTSYKIEIFIPPPKV